MRSGHFVSLVGAAVLVRRPLLVVLACHDRHPTTTAVRRHRWQCHQLRRWRVPDIPTIEVGNLGAVRQRRARSRRGVRRRQQDAGRRLQRDLPDPRGLDLHRLGRALHDGGRLRRRHPRRERGVRRRQHHGRRRLLGRLQDGRDGLRMPRARAQVRPRVRRRHDHRRRAVRRRQHDGGDGCSPTCARSSRARPATGTPAARASARRRSAATGKGGDEALRRGTELTSRARLQVAERPVLRRRDAAARRPAQGAEVPRRRDKTRPATRAAATATSRRARSATTATSRRATAARRRARWRRASPARRRMRPDTERLLDGRAAKCLELPVVYRDFKNESVSGGHPDFFYLGAPVTGGPTVTGVNGGWRIAFTQAVLRSQLERSGQEERRDQPLLGPRAGDPGRERQADLQHARTGAGGTRCSATASSSTGATTDQRRPRAGLLTPARRGRPNGLTVHGEPARPAGTRCITGARPSSPARPRFGQWWTDSTFTGGTHTVGTLEMKSIAAAASTSSRARLECGVRRLLPARSAGPRIFPLYTAAPAGPGATRTPRTVGTEPMLCNLWPYWYSARRSGPERAAKATSTCSRPACSRPTTAIPTGMNCRQVVPASRAGSTTSGSPTRRATCSRTTARSACSSSATTTCSSSSTASSMLDLGGVHQRLPGKVASIAADGVGDDHRGRLARRDRHDHPAVRAGADPYTDGVQPRPASTATVT